MKRLTVDTLKKCEKSGREINPKTMRRQGKIRNRLGTRGAERRHGKHMGVGEK